MIAHEENAITVAGVDTRLLAERFGTPLYVYDAEHVRASYRAIRAAFHHAPTRVHYAAVCNPNVHLLSLLRDEGAAIHANTPGDVYCARLAGFPHEDIVLSGSNLGEEDLRYLAAERVAVNLDSLDDVRRFALLRPGEPFGLRVHVEDALPESRMGLREHELDEAQAIARAAASPITALHVYCGTHGRRLERYRAALERLVEIARRLPALDTINLGGGFGYDYRDPDGGAFPFDELGAITDAALDRLARELGRPVTLRLEPGRALVAGAALLLTRVRSIKQGHQGNKRYVGVDTTVANLVAPAVHGAHRRVVAVEPRAPSTLPADVCGCTTYSRDVIAQDVELPDVAVGDLLAVLDVGAYGYCMGGHFLNRPRPAEVFVDGGEARLVTRREQLADLVALQVRA